MSARYRSRLHCDLCPAVLEWTCHVSLTGMRDLARGEKNWRRDKDGRDVCAAHPKRTGARK